MTAGEARRGGLARSGSTAIAFLWIAFGVAAWFTGYQGTMAYIIRPPAMTDLVSVKGRIVRVDTPVPRNKHEPYSELIFAMSDLKPLAVPVRHGSLSRADLEALDGRFAEVRFAGRQPRNRWAFDLIVEGRRLLDLDTEVARLETARQRSMLWSVASGVIASALLAVIAWRRRKPT